MSNKAKRSHVPMGELVLNEGVCWSALLVHEYLEAGTSCLTPSGAFGFCTILGIKKTSDADPSCHVA